MPRGGHKRIVYLALLSVRFLLLEFSVSCTSTLLCCLDYRKQEEDAYLITLPRGILKRLQFWLFRSLIFAEAWVSKLYPATSIYTPPGSFLSPLMRVETSAQEGCSTKHPLISAITFSMGVTLSYALFFLYSPKPTLLFFKFSLYNKSTPVKCMV